MSISLAPASTTDFTSSSFDCKSAIPLGNEVATEAILMFVPVSAFFAIGTMVGYTQMAATLGKSGY